MTEYKPTEAGVEVVRERLMRISADISVMREQLTPESAWLKARGLEMQLEELLLCIYALKGLKAVPPGPKPPTPPPIPDDAPS